MADTELHPRSHNLVAATRNGTVEDLDSLLRASKMMFPSMTPVDLFPAISTGSVSGLVNWLRSHGFHDEPIRLSLIKAVEALLQETPNEPS